MGYGLPTHCRRKRMEIEIIQGSTIIQAALGPPCKGCEEDKVQKDLLEVKPGETDRVTLSTESPLDTGASSGSAQAGLDNEGEDKNQGPASAAGPRTEVELSPDEKQVLAGLTPLGFLPSSVAYFAGSQV